MKWTGPKSHKWDVTCLDLELFVTYWISCGYFPASQLLATVFQVMRCKALRAPHDSAMVSCSLYLCSQWKSQTGPSFQKSDPFLRNSVEPFWRDWVGHAAARSQRWLWKLIKNKWWSNVTDENLIELSFDKTCKTKPCFGKAVFKCTITI